MPTADVDYPNADAAAPDRRPCVLIVDDNAAFSGVLSDALREIGCEAVQAFTGFDGLNAARRLRPRLITLDLDLPDLYGQVVLRQLRRDPATAEVPVLVITAHPELLQSEDYRAATAILCKPFNLDTLTDILRSATEAL